MLSSILLASLPFGFSATPTGGAEVVVSHRPLPAAATAADLAGLPRLYATTDQVERACRHLAAAGVPVAARQRLSPTVVVVVVRPPKPPADAATWPDEVFRREIKAEGKCLQFA